MVTSKQFAERHEAHEALDRLMPKFVTIRIDTRQLAHNDPAVERALHVLEAKRRAGEFAGPISRNVIALAFNAVLAELLR